MYGYTTGQRQIFDRAHRGRVTEDEVRPTGQGRDHHVANKKCARHSTGGGSSPKEGKRPPEFLRGVTGGVCASQGRWQSRSVISWPGWRPEGRRATGKAVELFRDSKAVD